MAAAIFTRGRSSALKLWSLGSEVLDIPLISGSAFVRVVPIYSPSLPYFPLTMKGISNFQLCAMEEARRYRTSCAPQSLDAAALTSLTSTAVCYFTRSILPPLHKHGHNGGQQLRRPSCLLPRHNNLLSVNNNTRRWRSWIAGEHLRWPSMSGRVTSPHTALVMPETFRPR